MAQTNLSTDATKVDAAAVTEAEEKARIAADRRINRHGFHVLVQKEVADHLTSWRYWILFCLLLLLSAVSLRGALNTISTATQQANAVGESVADYLFLRLFTTNGSSIYSFSTFLGFLGPLIGIMLGFDAINGEQSGGTLNRLAAQPIYRDSIINAKFVAAAEVIFLSILSIGFLFMGMALVISGLEPHPEEFVRVFIFLLVASLYICVWLAIAILFSTISKHAATSALGTIALWLFLTLFLTLLATNVANAMYPTDGANATVMDAIRNYQVQTGVSRISPFFLFTEVTSVLMNPNVHSLNIMSNLVSQEGQVSSYLPVGQSLLQIWPQIVAMIAEVVITFGISYVIFMKREIRA